jgi:CBS domain-containing protein
MQVREVMSHGVQCVKPDDTLQQAARKMRDLDIGPLPVCGDNDRLVGMITDRDIAVRAVADGWDATKKQVKDAMTPEVNYCFEDQDVEDASRLMREKQIRRLIVLNRDKRLVGIVSLGDLAVETGDRRMAGDALKAVAEPSFAKR